jgi:hypothetical protein
MARGKKHFPEEIVLLPREVEVAPANAKTPPAACREGGILEQTYYRWRREYDGLQVNRHGGSRRLSRITPSRSV